MPTNTKKKPEVPSSSSSSAASTAAASAPAPTPDSTLESELARGLKLTEELTSSTTTTSSSSATSTSNSSTIQPNKQGITVLFEVDLQYAPTPEDADAATTKRKCHLPSCPVTEGSSPALASCAQCKTARYCGRAHQTQDWKQGHKYECAQWKTLGAMAVTASAESKREEEEEAGKNETKTNSASTNGTSNASAAAATSAGSHDKDSAPAPSTDTSSSPATTSSSSSSTGNSTTTPASNLPPPLDFDKQDIASKLLCKVRLHLGPFTIAHYDKQGRGFAFVQSTATAHDLFIARPINSKGRPLERSVLIHFLTWGEFVSVVLEDDFEYTVAREPLEEALAAYDPEEEYVVLLKLRCGFLAVMRMPLVPSAGACRKLASDYEWAERTSVKLELD